MRRQTGIMALALGLAAIAPCAPLGAEGLEDFTFRRVKVSDMTAGARITVQIDPEEQARRLAATAWKDPALSSPDDAAPDADAPLADDGGEKALPSSTYAWFWDKVSPGMAAGGAQDRFELAMASLSQGPGGGGVKAPRMQSMQTIADVYGRDILLATLDTDVSPALVLAVMGIESAGRKDAVSPAGAVGLMQLIPATAERFGVTDSTDPAQNIMGGVRYLDWLMGEFGGDPVLVLAAYNSGEGAVKANQGVPPYAETRDYVPKVLAAFQVAQGLCLTPPMLVSDPCVFRAGAAPADG